MGKEVKADASDASDASHRAVEALRDAPGSAALMARPEAMVLRLTFGYGIQDEMVQKELRRDETIGLLHQGGGGGLERDAKIGEILASAGATWPDRPVDERWSWVEVGARTAATIQVHVARPLVDLGQMPSEDAAMEAIAGYARETGRRIAEATLAVGWGRADEQAGASTVMQGLGMLFDQLEGLHEATQLRREIGLVATPGAPKSTRPML